MTGLQLAWARIREGEERMSMQMLNGAGLLAALVGWGSAATAAPQVATVPEVRAAQGGTTEESIRCPESNTDCTQVNGTGVYTAEGGYAGIDSDARLMITHFINNAGSPASLTA